MPKNVCYFVGTHGDWGGASRILFNILRGLDRERFEPIVMLSGRGPICEELDQRGIEYHEWPANPNEQNPVRSLARFMRAAAFFRRKSIEIVHLNHGCLGWRPAEVLAARLLRIPVVTHCQRIVRKASPGLRWSTLMLACSEYLADQSDTGAVPTRTVYDLVNLEKFGHGKDIRNELGLAETDVTVSFVGRTRREKGVAMFVALATVLKQEHVRFLMTGQRVGRSTPDSYTEEEIADLVAQDGRIRYLGYREDIENIYASSDIIVMPSQVDEPCPAVLLEAGVCGKPVVATDTGSNKEFLSHGETGFLVARDDLDAMRKYVDRLISDKGLRTSMGASAKEIAERRFSREAIDDLQAVYSSLAG